MTTYLFGRNDLESFIDCLISHGESMDLNAVLDSDWRDWRDDEDDSRAWQYLKANDLTDFANFLSAMADTLKALEEKKSPPLPLDLYLPTQPTAAQLNRVSLETRLQALSGIVAELHQDFAVKVQQLRDWARGDQPLKGAPFPVDEDYVDREVAEVQKTIAAVAADAKTALEDFSGVHTARLKGLSHFIEALEKRIETLEGLEGDLEEKTECST